MSKSKTDIWMPFYIGDYLKATQNLNAEKHGIYVLLLFHYWEHGKLENDIEELSCVARSTEEKVLKILKKYFILESGYWKHERAEKEKAKANARSEAARESALKRWEKEKGCDRTSDGISDRNADGYAESMPNGCSSHSHSHSKSSLNTKLKSEDNILYSQIVDYLNEKCKTSYKSTTQKTRSVIHARLKEGYTIEDFKTVIDKKTKEWTGGELEKYLRPETLFGTKFESYLNQNITDNSRPDQYNMGGVKGFGTTAVVEV